MTGDSNQGQTGAQTVILIFIFQILWQYRLWPSPQPVQMQPAT